LTFSGLYDYLFSYATSIYTKHNERESKMSAIREGYSLDFKRQVAQFSLDHNDWPNTEIGKKFEVPAEYVRRWTLALREGRLEERSTRSTTSTRRARPVVAAPQEPEGIFKVEGLNDEFTTLADAKQAALAAVFEGKLIDIKVVKQVTEYQPVFELVQPK
jgi:transposase-like protein